VIAALTLGVLLLTVVAMVGWLVRL